jgi:hypothetical protein
MTPLTARTQAIVRLIFPQSFSEVENVLAEQCGRNLPLCDNSTPESLERLRFAALKVSNGETDRLNEAVELAKRDWRDVLMWAEFANDLDAHKKWADQLLATQ